MDENDQCRRRVRLECAFGYLTVGEVRSAPHVGSSHGDSWHQHAPSTASRLPFGVIPPGSARAGYLADRDEAGRSPHAPTVIVRRRVVLSR